MNRPVTQKYVWEKNPIRLMDWSYSVHWQINVTSFMAHLLQPTNVGCFCNRLCLFIPNTIKQIYVDRVSFTHPITA